LILAFGGFSMISVGSLLAAIIASILLGGVVKSSVEMLK
jgi:hypothetical protein